MGAHKPTPFGDLLIGHRSTARLTQDELAERANLSVEAVSALERGLRRTPRKDTVYRLADALQLSEAERAIFLAAALGDRPLSGRAHADGKASPQQQPAPLRTSRASLKSGEQSTGLHVSQPQAESSMPAARLRWRGGKNIKMLWIFAVGAVMVALASLLLFSFASNAKRNRDVAPRMEASIWSHQGPPSGRLKQPYGVAIDALDNIYVTDFRRNIIQKLSPAGAPLAQWGTTGDGPGQFNALAGVAVDPQGNLYMADTGNARVQELSADGRPLVQWGATGVNLAHFSVPYGVTTDGKGNLYVTDAGAGKVWRLAPDGRVLGQWGTKGVRRGQLEYPIGVAVDVRGLVYVADAGNSRIQRWAPNGQLLAEWGTAGSASGQFEGPSGVTVDSHGNVYVADTGNNRIVKLSPSSLSERGIRV
jgi:sugar lactone lactonase YvrE/transcriptional regulator with XRE-family HTH domain